MLFLPSFTAISVTLLILVLSSLVVHLHILPLLLRTFTQVRVSSFSVISITGLEWRNEHEQEDIIPTLRIERARWTWGGIKGDVTGLVVLRIEGVSWRIKNNPSGDLKNGRPSVQHRSPSRFKNRLITFILRLLIHHYPSIARLVSIQLVNCRVIFDDLDGIELTWKELGFGVKVEFRGMAEEAAVSTAPEREAPFRSLSSISFKDEYDIPPSFPTTAMSTPSRHTQSLSGSPVMHTSFALPPLAEPCEASLPPSPGKKAQTTPRLSSPKPFHSRMSRTANKIWTRATGRMYGSVSFNIYIDTIRCIDPRNSPPPSAKPSIPDLKSSTARRSQFISFRPLKRCHPVYDLHSSDAGVSTLVALDERSSVRLSLGFGPKKGLLGEDTLSAVYEMGKLRTTIEAVEKANKLLNKSKKNKQMEKKGMNRWSTHGTARVILRAMQSTKVSFAHITLLHHLHNPSPIMPSLSQSHLSSISSLDLSSSPTGDRYTIILELSEIRCALSSADSSNNDRARNAFGTNSSPESIIRGVGAEFGWKSIELQCIAPGESSNDKSQLFAIRQAQVIGFSSWRPEGWNREELLFASDPNIALVVCQADVASVDCAGDLQLLHELEAAWKATYPKSPTSSPPPSSESPIISHEDPSGWLPPRLRMVFDVGDIMAVLADRVSENTTTLTFALAGVHSSCYTSFSDIIARRRDRVATKEAFKEEEELQQRREENDELDFAVHPSMLPAALRRRSTANKAELRDNLSISMRCDATVKMEPIRVKMTLSGDKVYELAEIGRIYGTVTGDILGRLKVKPDGTESSSFDWSSISCGLDVGIQEGIDVDLWKEEVVEALIGMGEAHQRRPKDDRQPSPSEGKKTTTILDKLPSGISARLSLGKVNVFLGVRDPNPECALGLTRGLWFRTVLKLEYAYHKTVIQSLPWRHTLTTPRRAKLRLPEDITTQSLAFGAKLRSTGGSAALVSINTEETYFQPIYNGEMFIKKGGFKKGVLRKDPPKAREDDEFVGWGFQRAKQLRAMDEGKFANNVPPFEMRGTEQARRPWLRIPRSHTSFAAQQPAPGSDIEYKITTRMESPTLISDLSHIYCHLLAGLMVKRVSAAWRSGSGKSQVTQSALPSNNLNLSIDVSIPGMTAHFAFPLQEQLFMYSSGITFSKQPYKGMVFTAEQLLLYVPSPRIIGSWEELGRIKQFALALSDPHLPLVISPRIESFRVRIPFSYKLNSLILNINVTVKACKLLFRTVSGKIPFTTVFKPCAEQPKNVPTFSFSVGYISLEIKDDPVETSLNLIWRAGLVEQAKRNALEDNFAKKLLLISDPDTQPEVQEDTRTGSGRRMLVLTKKHSVGPERARWALDLLVSQSWIRRIRAAKHEQARREVLALQAISGSGVNIKLPIRVVSSSRTAPLFRAAFHEVNLVITKPGLDRKQIIDYMGKMSAPFSDDVNFSLMVPLNIRWSMAEAKCTLRDYPLPLIRVQRVNKNEQKPAFYMETTMVIAEELADDDSVMYVPVKVIPEGCGHNGASPFVLEIAKTIMPVKTYAEPKFKISSKKTTEFTWGNSYQPAIQDLMKVIETLSHPPRDPSPRVGFWDKFRLVLHWKPIVDFVGPCHLHLKGSFDPYSVSGLGSGFCLAWRGNTQLLIDQPNADKEAIQILADELVVAIPDLAPFHDGAAIGNNRNHRHDHHDHARERDILDDTDVVPLERRYTKPCAQFVGGVRVGFGFKLERTCRPWSCQHGCGDTENLLHRQCREFTFLQHQQVILRSPEAIAKAEKRLGRKVDSYEGFRSDFIHFSVSLVAPNGNGSAHRTQEETPDSVNSLHFAPKASHHFLSWWKLFSHQMSLPIRHGKLFPDSPPPSKKFGRSLGTIKYRFDLRPVYISHMYSQVSKDHSTTGKSESLGIKARFGRFRADAHQRAQEKIERHEKLGRSTVVVHKPFYAGDILADDLKVKGVRAHFVERIKGDNTPPSDPLPRASALPPETRHWYNYCDFIDVDRKPSDKDPRIELADFGDCPHLFYCKRVKARASTSHDDSGSQASSSLGVESSKFGHEATHHCYLGMADCVRDAQRSITQKRINELQARLDSYPPPQDDENQSDRAVTLNRINVLVKHYEDLEKETRHLSDETLEYSKQTTTTTFERPLSGAAFQDMIHIHGPRLVLTDGSRNIGFKYLYMMGDRKKEEYYTSYASLRGILDTYQQRVRRRARPETEVFEDEQTKNTSADQQMVNDLIRWLSDKPALDSLHTDDNAEEGSLRAHRGLPDDCDVKPNRHVLVFKPQIALRSESDPNAIVLLSAEEFSFKQFKVIDSNAIDDMMADVLDRNYISMQGLQGFYPTTEALKRERTQLGMPRGLDFIPLEIFLDVKSEATDYDRVLQKSDIMVSIDKFNNIRMPRGLEWPDTLDEYGEPIKHLRVHQDYTAIIAPMLTVTANSRNFEALYVIVTDLLMYEDPGHKDRSEAIDDFTRTFDAADRDLGKLVTDINALQTHMRGLLELQHGYESNFERLNDTGKEELFKIRSELQVGYENMYTINALIRATSAKDDARAAMKTSTKMDVRIGGVAWHMLRESRLETMAKVDINGAVFSMLTSKNGIMDNAMVIGDLKALNGKWNTLYPEIIIRDDPSKKKIKKPFAAVYWSTRPSIGGIPIFPYVNIEFVNIRFKLEERVGLDVMDYLFTDRTRRRQISGTAVKPPGGNGASSTTPTSSIFRGAGMTSMDDLGGKRGEPLGIENGPLPRSRSQVSLLSLPQSDRDPVSIKRIEDTKEMRLRASTNKMFGTFRLQGMGFNLSYKSDDTRKHGTFSMPDCVDFRFKTPEMVYVSKVWSMEDLFEHIKRDVKSSAWSQSGDIISQIFKKTSLFRSKERLKQAASVTALAEKAHKGKGSHQHPPKSPSNLRYAFKNSSNSPEPDEDLIRTISRVMSHEAVPPEEKRRSKSVHRGYSNNLDIRSEPSEGSSQRHAHLRSTNDHSPNSGKRSVEEVPETEEKGGGRIKGLLGKLKSKHLVGKDKEPRSSEDSSGSSLRKSTI